MSRLNGDGATTQNGSTGNDVTGGGAPTSGGVPAGGVAASGGAASGGKYPVEPSAVNPDYENGKLWDRAYLENNRDSYMAWCRAIREERGVAVVIDWKSFENGFDYEMTHKKKVIDRVGAVTPWNACDHLCSFVSLDPGLGIGHFPSIQASAPSKEFKDKIKVLRCTYKVPDDNDTGDTRVEYDPQTKTLTGVMTWGTNTDWTGFDWATKAWGTPAMKKEFTAVTAWLASH